METLLQAFAVLKQGNSFSHPHLLEDSGGGKFTLPSTPRLRLQELIGVKQRTYSDYELYNIRIPIDALIVLARLYDVDLNYIFGVSDKKETLPRW